MNNGLVWLCAGMAAPLLVVGASYLRLEVERLRRFAVGTAAGMLAVTLAAAFSPERGTLLPWMPALGGGALLRMDALSSALLPFAAALWLITVAVTPRAALDRAGLRRTALATLATAACFLTESGVALVALSAAAVWIFLSALGDPAHRRQRRVAAVYQGGATLLLGIGVGLLLLSPGAGSHTGDAGLWLIAISALVRSGIVPFHAWAPEVFDHGRLGPAVLFSAPQIGAYLTLVLIVPRASAEMLRVMAILALVTAVYGAALALAQTSARRACGYLFISQSALVVAGLGCMSVNALAGGLLVWLSAGLAFAGLARCVLVLEARRGRLALNVYHGGYDRTPVLAVSFLAMGLACTGFPGTLGFVGQEMLVDGAVHAFPVMGFAICLAAALTGMAVLRMYFSLFCGRAEARAHSSLRFELKRREAWTFAAVMVVLIVFGVAPRPLSDSQLAASRQVLQRRSAALAGGKHDGLPGGRP